MQLTGNTLPGTLVLMLIYTTRVVFCVPAITQDPSSQTVQAGQTVTLSCRITGKTNDYLVAWFADGQRITRSNNESLDSNHVDTSRYSLIGDWAAGDYTLEIQDVKTRGDAGMYQCVVSRVRDGVQVARSDEALVSVEFSPDPASLKCSVEPDLPSYRLGHAATFRCQSERGNPPSTLSWWDGAYPVNASEIDLSSDVIVEFVKEIGMEDNGKTFNCKLSHEAISEDEICPVGPLNVVYQPTNIVITSDPSGAFSNDGSRVVVRENDDISFTCSASANPEAEITWTLTEAPGCAKGSPFITSTLLGLQMISKVYDGATVTCEATNDLGRVSKSFMIIVESDDPNATCFPSTPKPVSVGPTQDLLTKAPITAKGQINTLHIIIIAIAAAFLIVIIILGYIALSRRRETPIQLHVTGGPEDTRSLSEASIIFHSRHNTPDPELRGNSLSRLQSNFSTMSYDTQSIDSATALMHLKSLESPEYRANPKLTGSPTRKLKPSKEMQMDELDASPFRRINITENTYEGSPKRSKPPTPTEKSALARQPSEHKYEECPPMKKYTTQMSQTDLTIAGQSLEEREEIHDFNDSSDDDEFYNPTKQNFSINNCNIRVAKHTEV